MDNSDNTTRQLERYCSLLESHKITSRKEGCEELSDILETESTIKFLKNSQTNWWSKILSSIQAALEKDHEKKIDNQKKKTTALSDRPPQSANLFSQFLRIAAKENGTVNFRKVFTYILETLNNGFKKHFHQIFLKIVSHTYLMNVNIRSSLQINDWKGLYTVLKSLCGSKSCSFEPIKVLTLVIKWGPLYQLPISILRDDFPFITQMCEILSAGSSIHPHEIVIECIYEFCKSTAKDSRMACCQLGENIIIKLIELYQRNDDKLKANLVAFFLLQVSIHNPNGVIQTDPAAYAVSADVWKSCLCNIFQVLTDEIETSSNLSLKNQIFFVCKNGINQLSDSFVCLYVDVCRQLFYGVSHSLSEEPPSKRRRVEFTITDLIDRIKETKSWTWINLTYCLIETYPDMLNSDIYMSFLFILLSLLTDSKDPSILHHTYKALITLKKIPNLDNEQSGLLWTTVAESSLRLIGMNSTDEQIQTLLQLLIKDKRISNHEQLFQFYRPKSSLNITEHNLKTLNTAFVNFTHLQFDNSLKTEIMNWILSSNNSQSFCLSQVAEILVCLTLKQWPNDFEYNRIEKQKMFGDIEDIYMSISFKILFSCENTTKDNVKSVVCPDPNLLKTLYHLLTNLRKDMDVKNYDITCLVCNVLGYLLKFEVIKSENIDDMSLYQLFEDCAKNFFNNLNLKMEKHDERNVEKMTGVVQSLNVLFNLNISLFISKKLRTFVSEQLIRELFLHLTVDLEDMRDGHFLRFKKTVIETLVRFSCVSDSSGLLVIQQRALDALVDTDYDCVSHEDYELVLTLLHSIKSCNPVCLTENTFLSIFNLFQKMCEARYHCYFSAVEILNLFYEIYPFVAESKSVLCKRQFAEILYPFYCKRLDYGADFSNILLKCMDLLFELDPDCANSKWSNEELVLKTPDFLTSDYQEVRFNAIKNLAKFFKLSSQTHFLSHYHLQEIMFSKISEMSLQIFQIEGDVTVERMIDETVTRSATILHIFASIMLASHLWVEEALFTLLKIVCEKKIVLSHVKSVIDMVAKKMGFQSGLLLLEIHLVALVNCWKSLDFDTFPFPIYNCDSKLQFYAKYWASLAHFIIENDGSCLSQIAVNLGKPLSKLIENICPKLLGYCIGQEVSNLTAITNNKMYKLLNDTLSITKAREVFKNNIEETILCLTEFICDENDFKTSFEQNIIFPKSNQMRLKVAEFQDCIHFIESTMYDEKSLISHLMADNPEKIYFILLQLNLRINNALALEEKMRYFHLYSIISLLCIESISEQASMQTSLTRDLTHTLLHHIKNHKNQLELSKISCKFFKTVLEKILPKLSTIVGQFFLVIISRLKHIALESCPISGLCVDMLEFLIVDHKDLFVSEIEKLDSIPAKFERIFPVYYAIKYNNRIVTLEDEIKQFLNFAKNMESLDECEHSLSHLKTLLADRKDELNELYSTLRQTRGFSENCEHSTLHKLICMLITLSCSTNSNVSTEAVRCLGEIGPADLATLILQPEKPIPDYKWTPWELLLGYALSLLLKYVIDSDVNVVKSASVALFQILSTKEGRKVAKSETDFGFGVINFQYLTPFCALEARTNNFSCQIDGDLFVSVVKNDNLWVPAHCCHKTWITELVCTFLETFQEREFFASFIEVCKAKVEFCEQILPLVIYTVLYSNSATLSNLISTQIEAFFSQHWDITVGNVRSVSITTDKSAVQSMLNVVHFVRLQRSVRKKKINDLKLDYLKVAKAAHFCTAHFTALLYAELWCQEQINLSSNDYALSTCSYTKLDLIYEKVDEITGKALQNILRQAYKAVGEVDALSGCGTSHLLNPTTRVEHYKELGRWDQVTLHYEMGVSLGEKLSLRPLVDSLKSAKLYQLSLFCSNALDEPNYESLWRLSQWDCSKTSKNDLSYDTYDRFKFYALKAMHDRDEFSFVKSLEKGRVCVVRDFIGANMESIKNFYNSFGKLQSLKEMEDFAEASKNGTVLDVLVKWKFQDDIVSNDYQYVEPIQAQRIVLLTNLLKKHQFLRDNLKEVIMDLMLEYARYARIEGNQHMAFRILGNLRILPSSNDLSAKIKFEEAQLCWSIQDVVTAKCILRQLCTNENVNPSLHAMALKMTGTWMVEGSSENRQTIIENYFQKSLNLIKKNVARSAEDEKSILDTFDQLAKFADREYQEVMSHIKSDIFQKKKENITKAKESISKINLKKASKDLKKAVAIKDRQSTIDEIEINNIETEKNNLLQLALRYYLLNLIGSDEHNITIFRLISLLLENRTNELIKPVLEKDLLKIPSYKFVTILPQLIPHISSVTNDMFNQSVNNVIEKCAKDHPYHTLPLILSLALSNKDRQYAESKAVINDARMQSAKILLKKLQREQKLATLIEKMAIVSEAVIELAYTKNDGADDESFRVPKRCKIRSIKNYDDVLLPTYTLPVEKSGEYNRIVGIFSFDETYHNVGGINAPKRISCTGTDGISRTQLVKGQDDLRQDAVMQQVFNIMNSLLSVKKQSKNLLIRTYKIVPLSMRSGILEWVENTIPIGEYLTGDDGDSGAHVKYRPMDETPRKCRRDYKNVSGSNDEKLRNFSKICAKIQPVFHKFFEESFPQPTVWYEKRRAYTHSVATSSMCGYILGIGDRHVNNILIDKKTAEVVHIDFGIAFEQGRVLPTPETVPFRLSRDVVDGMGVSGVEGVFRRSCEKTMEVLRLNYQTIITILEVLLYDPLYDWTVSSSEANKRQKDDDSELNMSVCGGTEESRMDINVTAERALLRLKAKLQGTESGKLSTVEHQVGTLIQQAVDPSNLSRLFHGWQPYL